MSGPPYFQGDKMLINDLSARVQANYLAIQKAMDKVMLSGWFILGPEVSNFEKSFAQYLKAKYCVSLANGTDAIELALKALGVGYGDKVATVANAGMYTSTALINIGAKPFFVDVDLNSQNTTLLEITRAIAAGVKAVVVTHLYGLAVPEICQISEYCKQMRIPLLEDCSQAHGACVNGQYVGTFGDVSSFSFYPTKNLGALGDGGAIVTNNSTIAENVKYLRQYGWVEKYKVELPNARNSRLDELQAAVLSVFLPMLDTHNENRRKIAQQYSKLIHNKYITTPSHNGQEYVSHLYVIRTKYRDSLSNYLRKNNINTDIHYPIPDHKQSIFREKYSTIQLPNTELLCNEILTIPCYPEMDQKQILQVIDTINEWQP